jgi:MFS family permease
MGVLMLGAGLQSTLLGVRATGEAFPTAAIGVIMSCYYVGFLFGTTLAPRLIRQVGHVRVFAAFASVASVATLCHAVFVDPIPWAIMRLLTGMCFAGIYVVAESWLNDHATQAARARLLAVYMVVLYVGLGASQFLLLTSEPSTDKPFMLIAGLICLAIVPLVLSANPAPVVLTPRAVRFRDLHHLLAGPRVRATQRHGYGGDRGVHGGQHSRWRRHAVPDRCPGGSHGSACSDRGRVRAGHGAESEHRLVDADAAGAGTGNVRAGKRSRADDLFLGLVPRQ